jgi:putative tricarboxylic transport membrane protein
VTQGHGDVALGLGSLAFAGVYFAIATQIPESLLADAVGAAGFPNVLAIALALCGALLILRTMNRAAPPGAPVDWPPHVRAAGLVSILVAYIVATPLVGYPVALALLIGAVAAYAGARGAVSLVVTAAAASLLFWAAFAKLLGVAMPLGLWTSGG